MSHHRDHPHDHKGHAHDHDGHERSHTHEEHGHRHHEHDDHEYPPGHGHGGKHGHTHGVIDPSITTSRRGIWAVKWSFGILFITALFQLAVVFLSGSVALLADTIHNVGDAATAVPLWIAFALSSWKPSKQFTYGFGRVEDLAGLAVVLVIAFSAVVAGYESIQRLMHPQAISHLWAVVAASIIGVVGNEAVAIFRIKVGREIESAALVADGYHARADGLASLAVALGALGVWLGFPLADPIVGLLITLLLVRIVWQSSKAVFTRMLDGVAPGLVDEIRKVAMQTPGVECVTEVRTRWLGHRLHAELNVAVASGLSVMDGHAVAKEVRHRLMHHLNYLSSVTAHVDPIEEAGEDFHRISMHTHDGLEPHSH